MENKICSLKSSYVETDENSLFNYKVSFINLFPNQLNNVLTMGEYYQIIDDINSISIVRPHLYIFILFQSISLYFLLQLMVSFNLISKLSCTIFFSLVLIHFLFVSIIFLICLFKSFKLNRYLKNLNNQFKERSIKFKTKYENDNGHEPVTCNFIGKILFLFIPFIIQLELIYNENPSPYILVLSYIVLVIFLIFIFNILKNLILFSSLRKLFFGDKQIDLSQIFYTESLIISYKNLSNQLPSTSSSLIIDQIITPNYTETTPILVFNA